MNAGWTWPAAGPPPRRLLVAIVALGVVAMTYWAVVPTGRLVRWRSDAPGRVVELRIAADGSVRVTGDDAGRGAGNVRSDRQVVADRRQGSRFVVSRIELGPQRAARPLRVRTTFDPGVERELVVLRVAAPGSAVELGRSPRDGRPFAVLDAVDDRGPRPPVLLVTVPARALSQPPRGSARRGTLERTTRPFDQTVASTRADQSRLASLRAAWWWLVPLGVLGTAVLPAAAWRSARRRFLAMPLVPRSRASGAPTGAPAPLAAVDAAALTRGAVGLEPFSAFVGHVLELVDREQVRMRRTADVAGRGAGVFIGVAAAGSGSRGAAVDPGGLEHLDAAAVGLLRTLADVGDDRVDDHGDMAGRDAAGQDDRVDGARATPGELHLPDAASRVDELLGDAATGRRVARARYEWFSALALRERELGIVVRPPWRLVLGVALVAFTVTLVGAVQVLAADSDGSRASWWLAASLSAPLALALAGWARDAQSWRRVADARIAARVPWVAWRAVLGTSSGGAGRSDLRDLPFAVASGDARGVARLGATPDAVGLDAATVRTIASLRRLAGATDDL